MGKGKVKPKIYATEKVAKAVKALVEAPALPPRFLPHDQTISELAKHIRDLHFKKNYEARQIVSLLRENGIKTTLKEVKNLLKENTTKISFKDVKTITGNKHHKTQNRVRELA